MIYYTCPICGANLDPGEKCDCNRGAQHGDDKTKNVKENDYGKYVPCRPESGIRR